MVLAGFLILFYIAGLALFVGLFFSDDTAELDWMQWADRLSVSTRVILAILWPFLVAKWLAKVIYRLPYYIWVAYYEVREDLNGRDRG